MIHIMFIGIVVAYVQEKTNQSVAEEEGSKREMVTVLLWREVRHRDCNQMRQADIGIATKFKFDLNSGRLISVTCLLAKKGQRIQRNSVFCEKRCWEM